MADATLPYRIEEFTATDGYRWHYRHYPPAGALRAQLICLHGIQSHAGWYEYSCTQLAEAGYEVFFLDRRGSGSNAQGRGDTPSFRRLLDDIAEFLHARRQPGKKTFLLAISWGGKLAAALPRRHPGLVDGLLLLCPGFCPRITPPFRQRWRLALMRLLRPARLFPIPLNDPELFTGNPRWLDFLRQDPLALHQATARFLLESFRLDLYLAWTPRHVRMPVLLLLAGKDRIIDNDRTQRFVQRFAAGDKTVIELAEACHTLEFEPNPAPFVEQIKNWLMAHTC